VKEHAPFAGQVLGIVFIVVFALAARSRGFRTATLIGSGLLAVTGTCLVLFLLFWGFTQRDAGALVLMAMLLGALTLVPWIVFIVLRAVAKSAAQERGASDAAPPF
jgi:hypothetical protein